MGTILDDTAGLTTDKEVTLGGETGVVVIVAVLADFVVKTLHYLNCHCDFPCVLLSSFLLMAHFVC